MKTLTDNIKSILTIVVILISYGMLVLILLKYGDDKQIVSQVLIAVISGITGILGYYYGYSQGASKKDEAQAAQLANTQVTSTTTTQAPITAPEAIKIEELKDSAQSQG